MDQAKKLGGKIGVIKFFFDAVLSSPLQRVLGTITIATGGRYPITVVPELTCPSDGAHPIDVMFNELGYKPLSDYFKHKLGEHAKIWGRTALGAVLNRLGNQPKQVVLVGGHAVLQNALGWAICEALEKADEGYDVRQAREVLLAVSLGEGEAFILKINNNPHHGHIVCEHINLD